MTKTKSNPSNKTKECPKCGRDISVYGFTRHKRTCNGFDWEQKADEMVDGLECPGVYILDISLNGKEYRYVGETVNLKVRTTQHLQGQLKETSAIRFPVDGKLKKKSGYDIRDVEVAYTIDHADKERLRELERRTFIEEVKKYGHGVLGG